jgi:hypothetical protein
MFVSLRKMREYAGQSMGKRGGKSVELVGGDDRERA